MSLVGVKLEPKEVQRAVEHAHSVSEWWPTIAQATVFTFIGVLIAVGQILQTKDPVTWKEAVGRCITTGGLALIAGAAVMWFPGLPFIAQIAIAAMLASLGNSGLEMVIHRIFKIKFPER